MLLNTHSYFSLRYGTIPLDMLLQTAHLQGTRILALTDINNTSACLDFARMAPNYQIHPILGVDFRNNAIQQFVMLEIGRAHV